MSQILLKNGYIVSMNGTGQVFDGGSVLVENDKIIAVGIVDERLVKPDAEVIELDGKYVLPGFVNTKQYWFQYAETVTLFAGYVLPENQEYNVGISLSLIHI